jgi:hypothetical protein
MSVARVYTSKKVRKDWKCEKCGAAIRKGVDGRITFSVGFRGYEHTRCTRPECFPSTSERESSAVATVYAAQESVDLASCQSLEDLESAIQEVVDACEEVADEYESNEMFEINEDLQERAQTIRDAGESLSGWSDSLDDEPSVDGFDDDWLEAAREAAQDAINEMELP